MTTAWQALETLRLTCQECAAENRAEALDFGAGDDETRAQAVGASGAYAALEKIIAKVQAEGFDDPDPLKAMEAQYAATQDRIEEIKRSTRLRENCLKLASAYHETADVFEAVIPQLPPAMVDQVRLGQGIYMQTYAALMALKSALTPEEFTQAEEVVATVIAGCQQVKQEVLARAPRSGNVQ